MNKQAENSGLIVYLRILGPRTRLDKTPPGLQVAAAHIWGLQISRGRPSNLTRLELPACLVAAWRTEQAEGRNQEMHELPGRSWLEGSDQTWLLGVGPPRDWGRGDRRRQSGTDRDPRRRAWRRARACETGGRRPGRPEGRGLAEHGGRREAQAVAPGVPPGTAPRRWHHPLLHPSWVTSPVTPDPLAGM